MLFSQFCEKTLNKCWNNAIPSSGVQFSRRRLFAMALLTSFFIALSRFTCLVTICSRKIGRSLHHVAGCSLKFNICTEPAVRVYPTCHHESGLTSRPVVFFPCRKKPTRDGFPRRAHRSQQPSGLRINQMHEEDLETLLIEQI
jgi:hypothetical protein